MLKIFLGKVNILVKEIWFQWMVCLLLNIITLFYIIYKIKPSGKILALHYDVLVGVEWYGKGMNLYFVPLIGFLILAVNYTLHKALSKNKKFLPELVIFMTLVIEIILLASVLFLNQVN